MYHKNKLSITEGVGMKMELLGKRVVLYVSAPHPKRFVFFSHTMHCIIIEVYVFIFFLLPLGVTSPIRSIYMKICFQRMASDQTINETTNDLSGTILEDTVFYGGNNDTIVAAGNNTTVFNATIVDAANRTIIQQPVSTFSFMFELLNLL